MRPTALPLILASLTLLGCHKPIEPAVAEDAGPPVVTVIAPDAPPATVLGYGLSGTSVVSSVISDRGFWMGESEHKIFAVVREDTPRPEMIDINKGQRLYVHGVMLDASEVDRVVGDLEPKTRAVIATQEYFLVVYWQDIRILEEHAALEGITDLERRRAEQEAFQAWDRNGDGWVDDRELRRALQAESVEAPRGGDGA